MPINNRQKTDQRYIYAILILLILTFQVSGCSKFGGTNSMQSPTPKVEDDNQDSNKPINTPTITPTQNLPSTSESRSPMKTVFVIVMENHNWSSIQGNPSAPYINHVLLPMASYALQYYNPPDNHPSEPNYLWLEAGTNFGIQNDNAPSINHQNTSQHLVSLLSKAGVSWKAYIENISGSECPLDGTDLYAPEHNPMIFFNDVTDNNNPKSPDCIAHERPFSELAGDLKSSSVAQYNFIVPNRCDDMHNSSQCATADSVKNGDTWLSNEVPSILNSQAYQDGGVLFITWDEAASGDGPIGMILLSPYAKGGGYTNTIHYTHSSLLRTIEEIFAITPFLGDAANANDLQDLFKVFP